MFFAAPCCMAAGSPSSRCAAASIRIRLYKKMIQSPGGRPGFMDLQQLRCFVVTAEELHFGRAAQKLGMMPSALGRHIKLLEEELATRLIDRTTRSVALTGDGTLLLDHARTLLADASAL